MAKLWTTVNTDIESLLMIWSQHPSLPIKLKAFHCWIQTNYLSQSLTDLCMKRICVWNFSIPYAYWWMVQEFNTDFFSSLSFAASMCRMQRFWKVFSSIESWRLWNSSTSMNLRDLKTSSCIVYKIFFVYAQAHTHTQRKLLHSTHTHTKRKLLQINKPQSLENKQLHKSHSSIYTYTHLYTQFLHIKEPKSPENKWLHHIFRLYTHIHT